MDTDSNIKEQLTIVEEITTLVDGVDEEEGRLTREELESVVSRAVHLAELVDALNTWLVSGGMLPAAWGTRCVDVSAHERMRP